MIVCKFSIIFLLLIHSSYHLLVAEGSVSEWDVSFVETVGNYLDGIVASLAQQKRANANGTRSEFRNYLLEDKTNENLGHATPQQIISRSGYNYENHYVLTNDGYITLMIRIVNPLADQSQLKQPPVMLFHGGVIDQTVWIWTSAIQHHPERYPRSFDEDGPITSWNKSLAFTLANNGYDVWLVGTRGSNSQNQGHMKYKMSLEESKGDAIALQKDRLKYWTYTMDELVEHEFPRQIDRVLQITGASKVSIVTISESTQISLALFGSNKKYALKTHNYVAISPIINNKGANKIITTLHKTLCIHVPDDLGTLALTEIMLSQAFRDWMLTIGRIRKFRYAIIAASGNLFWGPSPIYQSSLEPGVVGHLFQPVSFKQGKHYCQQVNAGQLQKFDHGLKKNLKLYGSISPPAYNISQIHIKNWLVVSGGNDHLATTSSVEQVLETVRPRGRHIFVSNFNHLDLVAGMEADIYVNLPIMNFLDKFHLPPLESMAANLPDQGENI